MEKDKLDIENINIDDEEGFIIVKFKRKKNEGEFKYYLSNNYGYIEYIKFKDNNSKKYVELDIYSNKEDELYALIHKWVKENVKLKRKIIIYDIGISEK